MQRGTHQCISSLAFYQMDASSSLLTVALSRSSGRYITRLLTWVIATTLLPEGFESCMAAHDLLLPFALRTHALLKNWNWFLQSKTDSFHSSVTGRICCRVEPENVIAAAGMWSQRCDFCKLNFNTAEAAKVSPPLPWTTSQIANRQEGRRTICVISLCWSELF